MHFTYIYRNPFKAIDIIKFMKSCFIGIIY
nr:MAG TPA: hypothetical protein [Bacteriophage sp.]